MEQSGFRPDQKPYYGGAKADGSSSSRTWSRSWRGQTDVRRQVNCRRSASARQERRSHIELEHLDSADPPLDVDCLHSDRHRQLRRHGTGRNLPPGSSTSPLLPLFLLLFTGLYMFVLPVCRQVAQRASAGERIADRSEHDGRGTSQQTGEGRKARRCEAGPAKPVLLSGGNPQIAKGYGDAPVQAYIAAMPGWKSELGRRLDALIERTVPGVKQGGQMELALLWHRGRGLVPRLSLSSRSTSK